MRRDQLEHLIRAGAAVIGDDRVIVIGSQAILATFPDGLPALAVVSLEADLLPFDDPDGARADAISGKRTARLPVGWRDRLVPVSNANTGGVTGFCLEPHDLCVSKLLAGRPKDLDAGNIRSDTLRTRIPYTDATDDERARISAFLDPY